jgi:hypothetical protein
VFLSLPDISLSSVSISKTDVQDLPFYEHIFIPRLIKLMTLANVKFNTKIFPI